MLQLRPGLVRPVPSPHPHPTFCHTLATPPLATSHGAGWPRPLPAAPARAGRPAGLPAPASSALARAWRAADRHVRHAADQLHELQEAWLVRQVQVGGLHQGGWCQPDWQEPSDTAVLACSAGGGGGTQGVVPCGECAATHQRLHGGRLLVLLAAGVAGRLDGAAVGRPAQQIRLAGLQPAAALQLLKALGLQAPGSEGLGTRSTSWAVAGSRAACGFPAAGRQRGGVKRHQQLHVASRRLPA